MEWNWLNGLLYGLLGGFFEFLPASPYAHQTLLQKLLGLPNASGILPFGVHLGGLLAVVLAYNNSISMLRREQKIASLPAKRRKRQPDANTLIKLRLLKIGAVPVILSCVAGALLQGYFNRVWVLAIVVVLNGVLVLVPQYMPKANKETLTVSPLDVVLVSSGSVLAIVPGISRVGMMTAFGSMRGMSQGFGLEFTYLLSVPALAALCVADVAMLFLGGLAIGGLDILLCFLAMAASFAAGFIGIQLMRFLSVKVGFEGFAYYNWGVGILIFIIYLIG